MTQRALSYTELWLWCMSRPHRRLGVYAMPRRIILQLQRCVRAEFLGMLCRGPVVP